MSYFDNFRINRSYDEYLDFIIENIDKWTYEKIEELANSINPANTNFNKIRDYLDGIADPNTQYNDHELRYIQLIIIVKALDTLVYDLTKDYNNYTENIGPMLQDEENIPIETLVEQSLFRAYRYYKIIKYVAILVGISRVRDIIDINEQDSFNENTIKRIYNLVDFSNIKDENSFKSLVQDDSAVGQRPLLYENEGYVSNMEFLIESLKEIKQIIEKHMQSKIFSPNEIENQQDILEGVNSSIDILEEDLRESLVIERRFQKQLGLGEQWSVRDIPGNISCLTELLKKRIMQNAYGYQVNELQFRNLMNNRDLPMEVLLYRLYVIYPQLLQKCLLSIINEYRSLKDIPLPVIFDGFDRQYFTFLYHLKVYAYLITHYKNYKDFKNDRNNLEKFLLFSKTQGKWAIEWFIAMDKKFLKNILSKIPTIFENNVNNNNPNVQRGLKSLESIYRDLNVISEVFDYDSKLVRAIQEQNINDGASTSSTTTTSSGTLKNKIALNPNIPFVRYGEEDEDEEEEEEEEEEVVIPRTRIPTRSLMDDLDRIPLFEPEDNLIERIIPTTTTTTTTTTAPTRNDNLNPTPTFLGYNSTLANYERDEDEDEEEEEEEKEEVFIPRTRIPTRSLMDDRISYFNPEDNYERYEEEEEEAQSTPFGLNFSESNRPVVLGEERELYPNRYIPSVFESPILEPSTRYPSAFQSQVTEPSTRYPSAFESQVTEPSTRYPSTFESQMTEPSTRYIPSAFESQVTEPSTRYPSAFESQMTEPSSPIQPRTSTSTRMNFLRGTQRQIFDEEEEETPVVAPVRTNTFGFDFSRPGTAPRRS